MWNVEWTMFLVSEVTGKWMPHWTAHTRERCREERKSLLAQCGTKKIRGIKIKIVKTRDVFNNYIFTAPI